MALLHRLRRWEAASPARFRITALRAVPSLRGCDLLTRDPFPEPPSGHLILTAQRVGAVVDALVVAVPCFDLGWTSVTLATVWPPTATHFEADGQATAVRVMGV